MCDENKQSRIDRIFNEACKRDGEDRERYLAEACGGDTDLRYEVEKLLAADNELVQNRNALPKPPLNQILKDLHDALVSDQSELESTKSFATDCEQCGAPLDNESGPTTAKCQKCGGLTQTGFAVELQSELSNEVLPSRFLVNKIVGEGSFGVVVKARDSLLDRDVAIKIPKSEMVSRKLFVREAKIASRLRHENIVTIHDVNDSETFAFIVSDFIDGTSLNRWRRQRELTTSEACELCITLAKAMENAHQQGVIHRDLKPSNIVMDTDGQPHILDFGLSKSRTPSEGTVTRYGTPIGTPGFMPPEQVHGDSDQIDAKSDVYSLGVILYQMLTGMLPFSGEDIYESICNDPPRPIQTLNKKLPLALNAIVMKALSKSPEDRYQTAGSLAEDLQRFLDGKKVAAYPKVDSRVVTSAFKRWAVVGAAAILLLFVIGLLMRGPETIAQGSDLKISVIQPVSDNIDRLVWQRYDERTGRLGEEEAQSSTKKSLALEPGFYRVKVFFKSGRGWWEVFRTVPKPDEVPVIRDGITLNHRYWEFEDEKTARLPVIENRATIPDIDSVFRIRANSGGSNIKTDKPLSGYLKVPESTLAFSISKKEYTIEDVKLEFANASLTFLDVDVVIAYCELKGVMLPSIEAYYWVESQVGTLPETFKSGLPEWTSSPRPQMDSVPGFDPIPGDLDEFLYVKSVLQESPMTLDSSIVSAVSVSPMKRMTKPTSKMGFRIIWGKTND